MNWNVPYGVARSSSSPANNHVSPLSDFTVATPPSPRGAPSPMAMAVQTMTTATRARLLAQGRHNDLLKSMEEQQRVYVSHHSLDWIPLKTRVVLCQCGCINIGFSPSRQRSIEAEALQTGLPTCLALRNIISKQRSPFLRRIPKE